MTPQPAEYSDEDVYAAWHRPLLEKLFSQKIDLHFNLYELTHSHRREHNGDQDEGPCDAYPSPPYRAPIWGIVADIIGAKRFLEVGTALGYCTALMADAGGPDCQVDTIESDSLHADIAEAELSKLGLADRVRVLRGDAADVLASLTRPYDVVFLDGGMDVSRHAERLLNPTGARPEIKSRLEEPLMQILGGLRVSIRAEEQPEALILSHARDSYRDAVNAALED